jgi:hypothetical protein
MEVTMKKLTTLALATMTASSFAAVEHYGTMRASYISASNVYSSVTDDTIGNNGGSTSSIPVFAQEDFTTLPASYTDEAHTQIAFNQSRYGMNWDGAKLNLTLMEMETKVELLAVNQSVFVKQI